MSGCRAFVPSRRAFAALLLGAVAAGRRALAGEPENADRGLGGTGAAPLDPAETLGQDRGIGGTGVIGTIRRFGSIVVNDLRVTFPADVSVSIDGRRAAPGDLRLGHVVRVLARARGGVLATRAIVADSEVVGPLEARIEGGLIVMGQRIVPAEGVALPRARRGDMLAVSGLRRLDGTIVASLVERRPGAAARLHGPVTAGPDGRLGVGEMPVAGLGPALLARRVSLVGRLRDGAFRPVSVRIEPAIPFAGADRVSIEAYVARAPEGLRLGSGLDVSADAVALADLAPDEAVRAVVVARPGPSGRLDAESLRVEHDTRGSGRGSGTEDRGPAGRPGGLDGFGRPGGPEGSGRPGGADGARGAPGGGFGGGRGPGPGGGPGGGGGGPGGGPAR